MLYVKAIKNAFDSKEDLKDNGFSWNKEEKCWERTFKNNDEYNKFIEHFLNVTYYGRKVVNRYHSKVEFEVENVQEPKDVKDSEKAEAFAHMKTWEEVVSFVRDNSNDYAYAYGAGIMYANDPDTREAVANIIEGMGLMTIVGKEECMELAEEEGDIYKFWNWNKEAIYIAIFN